MLDVLFNLKGAVSGAKTYVIAVLIVAIAISEGLLGFDIPGVDVGDDWLGWMLNGLGLGTVRAGIGKAVGRGAD